MHATQVDTRRVKVISTKQQRKAARLLADGVPITRALIAAGCSDAQARKGVAAIRSRAGLCQALVEETKRRTPEAREALVRGRLIWTVIHGVDHGVRSAKILGSEKGLSMWQRQNQTGIIVIHAPRNADKLRIWRLETAPADLRLSSRRQLPTSSR